MNPFDLSGRVAFVTGGNGGLGLGMAKGLARAGARIFIGARNKNKAEAALKELRSLGATADFVDLDVLKADMCKSAIDSAAQQAGRLDILINNAGASIRKMPQDFTPDDWRHVIDSNLSSLVFCSQAAYPHFTKAGGGKIINIGSIMSMFGAPYALPYTASKTGVLGITRSIATAWAKENIQVNAILPGFITTAMTDTAKEQVPGLNEKVLARTPVGRWGVPDDLAGAAVFLASKASDFVTGASLTVDGGYAAQS